MELQRYQLFVTQIFLCLPIHIPNYLHFHSLKLWRRNRGSKDFRWHPHKNFDIIKTGRAGSPICMIFYSTKLTDSERSSHIQEFFRESFPMFSSCEAPMIPAFLLFKYFHSLVFSGKFPRLHSLKLCKEIATQRIFGDILFLFIANRVSQYLLIEKNYISNNIHPP